MDRGRLWTMRQFAGFGTPRHTNDRFRFLLDKGQTGLSTAFDLPTLLGLDSDDPRAFGEVGRLGVAMDTIEDMRQVADLIVVHKADLPGAGQMESELREHLNLPKRRTVPIIRASAARDEGLGEVWEAVGGSETRKHG